MLYSSFSFSNNYPLFVADLLCSLEKRGRELKYIVISHMESDEAGGIFVFRKAYHNVIVICGPLAARELPGWGYEGTIEIKSGKDELDDGEFNAHRGISCGVFLYSRNNPSQQKESIVYLFRYKILCFRRSKAISTLLLTKIIVFFKMQ